MLVFVDRRQRKDLRIDGCFQVKNQTDGFRIKLADADVLDVGIVRLDFGDQFFQGRVQLDTLYIDDEAFRVGQNKVFRLNLAVMFQCDTCIVIGRPCTDGDDIACMNR